MPNTETTACFLNLPCELRNAIYLFIFDEELASTPIILIADPSPIAKQLKVDNRTTYLEARYHNAHSARQLAILRTCRQIHREASLLALSLCQFHLSGELSYPDCFDLRSRTLSPTKLGAIRHLTLTARISHLRALNEAWAGAPFGHPSLDLDTLTIVPKRPETYASAYAEVADLSQSHTIAYILAETFKSLRNVRVVEVQNQGCFNEIVWRIVYRSVVYRMWRWGGQRCGVRLESGPEDAGSFAGTSADFWFRVHLQDRAGMGAVRRGSEVGDEMIRLVGGTAEDVEAAVPFLGP